MSFSKVLKDIIPGDLGEPGGQFVAFPLEIVDILTSLGYDLGAIPDIFKATLNNGKTYYFAPLDTCNSFLTSDVYYELLEMGKVGMLDYIDSRSEVKGFTFS
jgi:hypothetical protein